MPDLYEPEWFQEAFNDLFPAEKATLAPKQIYLTLGWPKDRVYRAIKRNNLDAYDFGGKQYEVPRTALKKWLLRKLKRNQLRADFDKRVVCDDSHVSQ